MARTAQKYNFKAKLVLPWHTLNKPVHYVLRVGDKSRIERFVGIAFLPELFGELFAGHDCLLRLCFHMCWDRDVLSAGYAYAGICELLGMGCH